jgi:U3 small nucleolar RNA-associated protein 6
VLGAEVSHLLLGKLEVAGGRCSSSQLLQVIRSPGRSSINICKSVSFFGNLRGAAISSMQVLTKALQLHPARPALWIYAAAWEFEANQNAFAARSLMQRGLRMCPKSEQLWLEYLRMELTYAQRLKARREVLGLGTKHGKRGAEDASAPAAKRKKTEGGSVGEESESEEEMEERRASGDAALPVPGDLDQLSYKVAASTFQNAIASIPSSLELRTKFLAVLEKFEFEGLERLEDEVYASMARDFAESREGRACLALRWVWEQRRGQGQGAGLSAAEARGKAANSFLEALELHGTPQLAEMYAHFLDQCMKELHAEGPQELEDGVVGEIRSAADAVGLLLEHLEACRKRDLASERMAERHLALLFQRSGRGPALEVASRYCEAGFRGSARLWVLRLGLEMQERREGQGADRREERLDGLFERALRAVAVSEALPIWNLVRHLLRGNVFHASLQQL